MKDGWDTIATTIVCLTVLLAISIIRDWSLDYTKIEAAKEIIKLKNLDCALEKELGITK
jgi:hypothetical protein